MTKKSDQIPESGPMSYLRRLTPTPWFTYLVAWQVVSYVSRTRRHSEAHREAKCERRACAYEWKKCNERHGNERDCCASDDRREPRLYCINVSELARHEVARLCICDDGD